MLLVLCGRYAQLLQASWAPDEQGEKGQVNWIVCVPVQGPTEIRHPTQVNSTAGTAPFHPYIYLLTCIMSSSTKPAYVSSSGSLGERPLAVRISDTVADAGSLAYLFFETLLSVRPAFPFPFPLSPLRNLLESKAHADADV